MSRNIGLQIRTQIARILKSRAVAAMSDLPRLQCINCDYLLRPFIKKAGRFLMKEYLHPMKNTVRARYVFIALLLALAVNYPMLSAANKNVFLFGLPLLYVYIGTVWLVFILLLFFTVNRKPTRDE